MPSQEAKLLSDFLLAPAPLRDFVTLRQFTDIFPRSHRENPAMQDLYRELHRLRDAEIEVVRNDITKEVKQSKQLRRAYAQERRQMDDAYVAGTDRVALQMEEEVTLLTAQLSARADQCLSSPAMDARHRIRYRQSTPASKTHVRASKPRSPKWQKRTGGLSPKFRKLLVPSATCDMADLHSQPAVKTLARRSWPH
jgi:hypothetical protein